MTKKPRVLIVEDDTWLAEEYKKALTQAGFTMQHAHNGLAAIDMIDHAHPSVLVLDLFLPGPNGLALIHEIRSHHDLASIPIVLITNMADQLGQDDLKAYGVSELLDKVTMTPRDIVSAVKKALP